MSVPGKRARACQSRAVSLLAGFSWPVTIATPLAWARCVSGMPANAAAPRAAVTPGTISKAMPAACRISASSPPRPKIDGSPPLSRTTRRPCRAAATTALHHRHPIVRRSRCDLGDAAQLRAGPDMAQQSARHQLVVDDEIGLSEQLDGTEREKSGMTGPGADQRDQGREGRVHEVILANRSPGMRGAEATLFPGIEEEEGKEQGNTNLHESNTNQERSFVKIRGDQRSRFFFFDSVFIEIPIDPRNVLGPHPFLAPSVSIIFSRKLASGGKVSHISGRPPDVKR